MAGLFPVDEYLKARQAQVANTNAQNTDNNAWAGALANGVMGGIQNGMQQNDALKQKRSEMFKQIMTQYTFKDADGNPMAPDQLMKIHDDYVQNGPTALQGLKGEQTKAAPAVQVNNGVASQINDANGLPVTKSQIVNTPGGKMGGAPQTPQVPKADQIPQGMQISGYDQKTGAPIYRAPRQPIERKQDQGQFDDNYALKVEKMISPLSASSRAVLGVAGTSNMRADRALQLLKPGMTPEDKDMVITDLQGVMKGGTPDEIQLKQGMYGSMYQNAVKLYEFVASHPEALDTPDTISRLKDTVSTLKEVDNKVISDNLGIAASAAKNWIKRNPDQWNGMVRGVQNTTKSTALTNPMAPVMNGQPQPQGMPMQGMPMQGMPMQGGQMPQGRPQGQPAIKPHPQDSVAMQWAQQNPQDPRAQAILKANGVQ